MAVTRTELAAEAWAAPNWPSVGTDPATIGVLYNPLADELVVFFDDRRRGGVVVWIEPPSEEIAVIADEETGEVVGVQVDNLLFSAVAAHPAWRALAASAPPAAAVADLLAEAKRRFDRYGAGETRPKAAR